MIASQSKALDTLINGEMEEAKNGCADFPNMTEGDFLRFCQYAYTGNYKPPPFGIDVEEEENPVLDEPPPDGLPFPTSPEPVYEPVYEPEYEPEEVEFGNYIPLHRKKGRMGKSAQGKTAGNEISRRREAFAGLSYSPNAPGQTFLHSCELVKPTSRLEDCAPVFLAHACLYVFADKYGVEMLKCLALDKLHKTLLVFRFFENRIGDVVELVRYSYCNDNTPDEGKDQLRDLVLQFITCNQNAIGGSESFLALLEEGGPLVRDFWVSIRKGLLI